MVGRSVATDWDIRCCSSSPGGYRVIIHDRRGQWPLDFRPDAGNDMDTYATEHALELAAALEPRDAIHIRTLDPEEVRSRDTSLVTAGTG